MPDEASPLLVTPKGLRLRVRLTPGASRDRVEGIAILDDGSVVLKVKVGAPPEGGKANAALIKLLATAWKLPKSAVTLVSGRRDRHKTLAIDGETTELLPRLQAWLKSQPGR